jgi:phage terminase Nu1 subunit (DNA packaging protein)
MQHVTAAEFARIKGVTAQAVTQAIASGRIKNALVYFPGKKKPRLDPVVAAQEWERNTDHSKRFSGKDIRHQRRPEPYEKPDVPRPEEPVQAAGGFSFNQSRAVLEAYKARLAKLDYEEKIGRLVEAEKVKADAFKLARSVRDKMVGIPDRVSAELSGISDQFRIHEILTQEIRNCLEELIAVAPNEPV